MTTQPPLILGTRGSALAQTQSNWVRDRILEANPDLEIEVRIIKTMGDTDQATPLDAFPQMGVFVKELQNALLDGRIDFAVHSLKDVPDPTPPGLILAAFPPREDARDAWVSRGPSFRELPAGSKVGTGSPRRLMQLRALRPDLEYLPIRGNVDTRLRKVKDGEIDAAVLATAGMKRLGLGSEIGHTFALHDMIPAIGQAALAMECRQGDARTLLALSLIADDATGRMVTLERRFMAAVGGGCKVPMAAHAYPVGDEIRFQAVIGESGTGRLAKITRTFGDENALTEVDEIAEDLIDACRDQGIPTPKEIG
jgi:hydroxymethylbilane synthase